MAEAYGKGGQADEALQRLSDALAIAHTHRLDVWEAELHRLQGELRLMQDTAKRHAAVIATAMEAEACFQQALDGARRQQARPLELRAAMSLSRLWQRQGKREAARQLLEEIYRWFTEGFDTADLQDAEMLLDELF